MGSSNFFIFFVILSLSCPHHYLFDDQNPSIVFVKGDEDLIQKTCKTTKYYNFCLQTLKSDPASTSADTKGLALIMAGIGLANSTATSSYLSSQLLSIKNDEIMKRVLKECAAKYTYAADALHACAQDLASDSYDYASMHITAAADYPNACHNAFKRYSGLVYPPELARREDGLKHFCDVVLGIIDNLIS
ncbi:hypothetical protein FNV43_RR18860 [Rhamnella rubrinervis]|uniref:Pectinesterase inhibitor domain-containing protein n=1 Tax=Rhamnella rubrinervis TaxID=2594499 RepID=A0A8K0GWG1_9ROSA|nr:hypothetical protein FNV43_RR18860 [Rhamnella rubrinervis]